MKTIILLSLLLSNIAFADEKSDLEKIAKCWNDQAAMGNPNGINNPIFMEVAMKGRECRNRQKDFEKQYGKKPKCVLDKYGSSYECND